MAGEINVDLDLSDYTAREIADGGDGSSDSEGEKSQADAQPPEDGRVMNPVTGTLVDMGDIDSVIVACDECKKLAADLRSFDQMIRQRALQLAQGTAQTRRIRGRKYQAKVVLGDQYPNQSVLKEAYNAFPQFRETYLRIGSLQLQKRETNKLANMTSDDPAFDQFKRMIEAAIEQGSQGLPSVTLENA